MHNDGKKGDPFNWRKTLEVQLQRCQRYQIGPLIIWIYRDTHQWMLAYDRQDSETEFIESATPEEKPENVPWSQYLAGEDKPVIQFSPLMPDRPVIVRPKNLTNVLHGFECVLFVFVPVWVVIKAGAKGELTLCKIPSVVLSNTWFGDTMSGEMCYSMRIPAELSVVSSSVGPHRVICPVKIKNKSREDLEFQRVCVRVEHLNIYEGKHCNWANEVSVVYEGEGQDCEIKYSDRPPQFEKTGALIAKSRTPAPRGLLGRTFGSIKSWSL